MPASKEDIDALFRLCKSGNRHSDFLLFKQILKKEKNTDILQAINDKDGLTPLMVAAFYGNKEYVKNILDTVKALKESPRLKYTLYQTNSSGATVFDLTTDKEILQLLTLEKDRQKRLLENPIMTGFHETSLEAYQFIMDDLKSNKYPMIGGDGGYFGGGIYFAVSDQESSEKALNHGAGFKCKLKMGNCLKIKNMFELNLFYEQYCDRSEYYETPVDVMFARLQMNGYDSVWGHQDTTINDVNIRILATGDEYVVYAADQVELVEQFKTTKLTFNLAYAFPNPPKIQKSFEWIPIVSETQKPQTSLNPILPTRPVKYYKLVIPETDLRITAPWPMKRIRDYLNIANDSAEDFQTGDLIHYTNPMDHNEDIKCARICFYIKYDYGEEQVPYFMEGLGIKFFNTMLINIEKQSNMIYLCDEPLKKYRLFPSIKEFYKHYKSLLSLDSTAVVKPFLLQSPYVKYNSLTYDEWTDIFPILKDTKYYYALQDLKRDYTFGIAADKRYYIIGERINPAHFYTRPTPFLSINDFMKKINLENAESHVKLIELLSVPINTTFKKVILKINLFFVVNCQRYTLKSFININALKDKQVYPTLILNEKETTSTNIVIESITEREYNHLIKMILPIQNSISLPLLQLFPVSDNLVITPENPSTSVNRFHFEYIIMVKNIEKPNQSYTIFNKNHELYTLELLKLIDRNALKPKTYKEDIYRLKTQNKPNNPNNPYNFNDPNDPNKPDVITFEYKDTGTCSMPIFLKKKLQENAKIESSITRMETKLKELLEPRRIMLPLNL